MSQEKVDKYKEYKANKAKILKKEKLIKRLEIGAAAVVAVAFIVWIGFSVYQDKAGTTPSSVTEINMDAFDEYLNTLE